MSWIVIDRATRVAVMETFSAKTAAAVRRDRFDVMEAGEYLAGLNRATDPGLDGLAQLVIPGAERISDRQLAERRMAGAMQAQARQRPADFGLFDTGARDQRDLFA